MTSQATTPGQYLEELPEDRKQAVCALRTEIIKNLPAGFREEMNYGMLGYVVPHEVYPAGYHCDPSKPLPFVNLASQKNFIALYHMGLYAMPKLMDWFVNEYSQAQSGKLDMGKSCLRFKKTEQIPFNLIGKLMKRVTVEEWISCYEATFKR